MAILSREPGASSRCMAKGTPSMVMSSGSSTFAHRALVSGWLHVSRGWSCARSSSSICWSMSATVLPLFSMPPHVLIPTFRRLTSKEIRGLVGGSTASRMKHE
eukprot:scaffold41220_cov71-Phaeocystis_antarctica.AAC.17